jgi:septal ring-binding cell division protein DamX
MTLVADQLARHYAEDFDWSSYRVEMMRLRVPEPLYYAPAATSNANVSGQAGSSTRIPDARPASSQAFRAVAAELPYIKASEKQTVPILQPSRAESTPAKLPPLAFWARTGEQEPKRDEIKLPGTAEQPAPPPRLASPPVLAIPNREPNLADANVSASTPVASASLPVAPSATAPVRDRRDDAQNGALDSMPGQPTNVISLSAEPGRPGDVVDVPAGSSGSTGAIAGGAGQSAGGSSRGAAEMPQNGGGTPDLHAPKAAQTSTDVATGRNSPAIATHGAEAFTRLMHPPNGNFDFVVSQSGGQANVPGFAAQLSGNPIYTVYLPVGDVTEWVLTFCVPVRKDSAISRYEVFIDDASPLSPPYPLTTTIPQSIIGEPRRRPLAFRGRLSAAGIFRDITASEATPVTEKIAAALSDWRFRPAKKNNTPTEVEILLTVVASSN